MNSLPKHLCLPLLVLAMVLAGGQSAGAIGIGPSGFYSFSGSSCGPEEHTDPVGALFEGTHAWARNVADQVFLHAGWSYTSSSPQWLWVNTGEAKYGCRETNFQQADHPDIPPSGRFHIRLWFVPASSNPLYKTVGTPHHEDFTSCGHAVDENGPEGSGFDQGRHALKSAFIAGGHGVKAEFWGNTANFKQCDGGFAGSDGYGVIITVNHQLEP